jgi:hypothetical protein
LRGKSLKIRNKLGKDFETIKNLEKNPRKIPTKKSGKK